MMEQWSRSADPPDPYLVRLACTCLFVRSNHLRFTYMYCTYIATFSYILIRPTVVQHNARWPRVRVHHLKDLHGIKSSAAAP